jgi:hypothetical protein
MTLTLSKPPLAKPLYLLPKHPLEIQIDEGKTLRLVALAVDDSKSVAFTKNRYPISRLSRLCISTNVRLAHEVMIALMQAGIPITVVNTKHDIIGHILGARRRETSIGSLLQIALDSSDWNEHYTHWFNAQQRAAAAQAIMSCGERCAIQSLPQVRGFLCNRVKDRCDQAAGQSYHALAALVQAEVSAELSHAIGDSSLLNWYRAGLNLIEDFSQLIDLHALVIIYNQGKLPQSSTINQWAIKTHEANAATYAQLIGGVLGSFERFLRTHWQ